MKKRVIINYDEAIDLARALHVVNVVIIDGKISECGGVPHYCLASVFNDCVVHTMVKKKGQTTDSFRVVSK